MDIVLRKFDEYLLDSLWSKLLPARIEVGELMRMANNSSFHSTALLQPTSTFIKSAATSLASTVQTYTAQQELNLQEWVTVSAWPRDDWRRQYISLCAITLIGIHLMYFIVAGSSYKFLCLLFVTQLSSLLKRYIVDHRMMQHPRFIKGQVWLEIKCSLIAFPTLTLITVPWFVGEARGWSRSYDAIADSPLGGGIGGYAYLAFSCAFFLWFTDLAIYFVHRWEHLPSVYKSIHKPHHRWVIPTPFASHAFHPLDGYAQSLPYHIFIYLFPIHRMTYLILFVIVNLWTIAIHDSDMITDHPLEDIINGPAHHTLHHMYFTCNYGQYFTWADKYFNSYRQPAKGDDPLLVVLAKSRKLASSSKPTLQRDLVNARRQEEECEAALAVLEGSSHETEEKKDR